MIPAFNLENSLEHPVESYAAALREDALARVRLGVLRAMSDETADPEVIQEFARECDYVIVGVGD